MCLMELYLSEGENAFLCSSHTAFHHDEVIIDFSIVGETTLNSHKPQQTQLLCVGILNKMRLKRTYHWGNRLLGGVIVGGGIVPNHFPILNVNSLTYAVDLRSEK